MFFQLEQRAASLLNLCCLVGGKKEGMLDAVNTTQ